MENMSGLCQQTRPSASRRRRTLSIKLFLLLLITILASAATAAVNDDTGGGSSCGDDDDDDESSPKPPRAFQECRLQYYVQVVAGDACVNRNFLPSGLNSSFSSSFGRGELFALNLTTGPERSSRLVGYARGFSIDTACTKGGRTDLVEMELISYNDGYYSGTILIQGEILSIPNTPNEVAIAGGTGSFRGVRGYGFVAPRLFTKNRLVYHHDLRFLHSNNNK